MIGSFGLIARRSCTSYGPTALFGGALSHKPDVGTKIEIEFSSCNKVKDSKDSRGHAYQGLGSALVVHAMFLDHRTDTSTIEQATSLCINVVSSHRRTVS